MALCYIECCKDSQRISVPEGNVSVYCVSPSGGLSITVRADHETKDTTNARNVSPAPIQHVQRCNIAVTRLCVVVLNNEYFDCIFSLHVLCLWFVRNVPRLAEETGREYGGRASAAEKDHDKGGA